MAREEYVSNDTATRSTVFGRHVSWSAIVAGLVVAMIAQILFMLIGIAIGAASVEPARGLSAVEDFGAGAAMWWIVTSLISLFLGAMTAGRLAGVVRKKDGALHGFLMWSAATVVTFLVAGTVLGGLFGGAFGALGAYQSTDAMMMSGDRYDARYADRDNMRGDRNNSPEGNIDLRTDQNTSYVGRTSERPRGSGDDTYAKNSATNDYDNTSTTTDRDTTSASNATDQRANNANTNDNDSLQGMLGTTSGQNRDDDATIGNTGGVGQDQRVGANNDLRDDAERAADAAKKVSLWALLGLLIGAAVSMFAGSLIGNHEEPERARRRVATEPVPHT